MVLKICPVCDARYTVMPHSGDFVHNCDIPEAVPARRQEDLIVVGKWEDFTGSGGKEQAEAMLQGVENKLWGTRAGIEGHKDQTVNARGRSVKLYRSRSRLVYIEDADKQ